MWEGNFPITLISCGRHLNNHFNLVVFVGQASTHLVTLVSDVGSKSWTDVLLQWSQMWEACHLELI